MGIARDLFLAGSPMRDMLASAAPLPKPAPQLSDIPTPLAQQEDEPEGIAAHAWRALRGFSSSIAQQPLETARQAVEGIGTAVTAPLEAVGEKFNDVTSGIVPKAVHATLWGRPMELLGGKFEAPNTPASAAYEELVNATAGLVSNPAYLAVPESKILQGVMGAQALSSGLQELPAPPNETPTERAGRLTRAGLSFGMAGLAGAGLAKDTHLKQGEVVEPPAPALAPEKTQAPLREGVPGIEAESTPAEAPPAEARVAERRVAEEPAATERRVLDRRREIAEKVQLPEDHPAVQHILDSEVRAEEATSRADTDALTGVGSRDAYLRAVQAIDKGEASAPGAVSQIDVRGAGATNKEFGEPYTDARLAATGRALQAAVGDRGKVFRKGGDEFVIHWNDFDQGLATHNDVSGALKDAHVIVERDGQVEASWKGVEHYGGFGKDFREASSALYARKPAIGAPEYKALPAGEASRIEAGRVRGEGDLAGGAGLGGGRAELAEGGEAAVSLPEPEPQPAVPPEPIKPTRAFDQAQPEVAPTPVGDEVAALRAGLEKAKGARAEQETLRHEEMSRRAGAVASTLESGKGTGASAFHKALSQLKGEIPKADFEPVVQNLSEQQITNLHEGIQQAKLTPLEKVSTFKALQKVLHPETPQIPQPHELALLERTFGPDLVKSIETKRATGEVWKQRVLNLINTPRTAMSILDMSIPLRQGLVLSASHPLLAAKAFGGMVKSTFSPAFFEKVKDDVRLRPTADFQNQSGLYLGVKQGLTRLEGREEAFQSNLLHKIPIVKHIVAGSERAGMSYLDKIRADVFDLNFDSLSKVKARDLGRDLNAGEKLQLGQSLAQYINSATGRGNLGGLERAAGALNAVFFSPRLAKGRLDLLNPFYYKGLDPVVRRQAIADMTRLGVVGVGLVTLAKLGGADVESDPRSSDFGKMRFGKTRIDPWGGFQPWVRFAAQLYGSADPLHGKLGTGLRKKLTGAVVSESRADLAGRFAVQKLSPQAALVLDLLRGKTALGDEVSLSQEVKERLVPLFIQDLKQVAEDNPDLALGAGIAGFFGAGVQTYDEPGTPTAMERYLKDEMERLGYQPEEPSSHTTVKGRKVELEPDEVRTLKKAQMKAADEARRVIRSSHYRRLSDTDRKYELERIFQKWRSRGHQRIQGGVKARYRDLPREPAGPQVGLGG